MEIFKVKACSPPSCSCPTLTIEHTVDGDEQVIITDDYNGTVIMTVEEFAMLANGFINRV